MVTKRKLKDPNSPVVKRPASEIALQAKIIELDDYRRAHALAVRAQIEDEQATSSMLKRDPGLAVEKRKLDFKIQRAIAETELLAVQARGERGKTPEAKTDWESAQRDRAQAAQMTQHRGNADRMLQPVPEIDVSCVFAALHTDECKRYFGHISIPLG